MVPAALWEIMPQSVRNEQRNGTITAALNDTETATAVSVWTPTTVHSFSYLISWSPAQLPHNL